MVKVAIKTQGCSHNYSDSEHMAGLLEKAGHILVSEDEADVVLFNTCTVKTPTENTFIRELKKLESQNKKIVLGGCIPQASPTKFSNYSVIGTRQLDNVSQVVEKANDGVIVQLLSRKEKPNLLTKQIRRNKLVETVPVSLGCLSTCSFCKTKAARGVLTSYPLSEIVTRIRNATSEGVKHVWLTSQDTGCYGFDIGTNAAKLLKEICKIEKDFMIRFGMGNPDHFLKIKDELLNAFTNKKVFSFVHIPVQSGNNDVLSAMKRTYSVSDFESIVFAFKKMFPKITISTDIIVGFPGETHEQFLDTVKLLEKLPIDIVNISRFWPRPGTHASRLDNQLHTRDVKERSRYVTQVWEELSLKRNKGWIGWVGFVTVVEKGKHDTFVGRNSSYKPVILKNVELGEKVKVKIVDATTYDLRGEVIEEL